MPVFKIRALPQKPGVEIAQVIRKLCCRTAEVLGMRETAVFATWETVAPGHYAEGGVSAERQPDSTHPPIVDLVAFEGRSNELIERTILAAAEVLGRELKIAPGNFFITFTEAKSGRIFTGGQLKKTAPKA